MGLLSAHELISGAAAQDMIILKPVSLKALQNSKHSFSCFHNSLANQLAMTF